MMTLIIGGSGSGKSAYAEKYIDSFSEERMKYYLATMQVFDKEGEEKIAKHREMRAGKGFITIEQPMQIQKAVEEMCVGEKAALLECMSNLTANEMFVEQEPKKEETMIAEIVKGIAVLAEEVSVLVIVSNNVFEDGITYDETTMRYIRVLAEINKQLATMADEVIEVVVGIPVVIKANNARGIL